MSHNSKISYCIFNWKRLKRKEWSHRRRGPLQLMKLFIRQARLRTYICATVAAGFEKHLLRNYPSGVHADFKCPKQANACLIMYALDPEANWIGPPGRSALWTFFHCNAAWNLTDFTQTDGQVSVNMHEVAAVINTYITTLSSLQASQIKAINNNQSKTVLFSTCRSSPCMIYH